MQWLTVALLAAAAHASTSQWSDRGIQQTIVDGVPTAKRIVEVTCLPQNWAPGAAAMNFSIVNAEASTSYTMSLRCRPPQFTYTLQRMYYVPRMAKLYVSEMLLTSDPSLTMPDMDSVLARSRAVPAMKRHMLQTHHDEMRLASAGLENALHKARKAKFDLQGMSFNHFACNSILNTIWTLATGCQNQFPSQEVIDNMQKGIQAAKDAAANLQEKFQTLFNKEAELENNVFDQFQQQQYFNDEVRRGMAVSQQLSRTAMNQGNAAIDMVNTLSRSMKNQFSLINSQTMELYGLADSNAQNIQGLAGALGQAQASLLTQINVNANRTNELVSNLTDRIRSVETELHSRDYAQMLSLRLLTGQFIATVSRFQEVIQHTIDMRAKYAYSISPSGDNMNPFVLSEGVAPPLIESTVLEIDNVRVRYFLASDPLKTREDMISFKCSASFVTNNLGYTQQPGDVINAMGPQGCVRGAAVGQNPCNCFIEWQWKTCTTASTIAGSSGPSPTSHPDYFKQETSPWFSWYTLNGTMCQRDGFGAIVHPTLGTVSPLFVSNTSLLLDIVRGIASRAADHGDYSFAVTTAYYRRTARALFDDTLVKAELMDILRPQKTYSFVSTMMRMINSQQGGFAANPEALARSIYGVPPTFTLYDYPMLSLNGSVVRGSQAVFIAFDKKWLPVYRMRPSSPSALLDVTVYNDQNRSDVRTFTAATYNLNNAMQNALPGNTKIVGSPFGDEDGYVYNVDPDDVGAAAVASGHIGKVSYAWCTYNSDAQCTPQAWADRSQGQKFDPYDASNVAGLYKQRLRWDATASAYRCASLDTVGDPSSICRMREDYNIRPGSSNNLTLIAEPGSTVGASYSAVFEVPVGVISNVYVSDCPVVSPGTANSRGVTFNLINSGVSDITFLMTLESPCNCNLPTEGEIISIRGSATATRTIPACEGDCRTVSASFFRLPSFLPCVSAQNVNATAPTQGEAFSRFGIVDPGFLNTTIKMAINTALVETQTLSNYLTQAMLGQLSINTQVIRMLGLDIMAPNFTWTETLRTIADAANNASKTAQNGQTRAGQNNLDWIDAFIAENEAIKEANNRKFNVQSAQYTAILGNMASIATVQSTLLDQYADTKQQVQDARNEVARAIERYTNATNDALGTVVAVFQNIRDATADGSLGGLLGLGDLVGDAIDAGSTLGTKVTDLGKTVVDKAIAVGGKIYGFGKTLVEEAVKLAKEAYNAAKGILDGLLDGAMGIFVTAISILVASVAACAFCFIAKKTKCFGACGKNDGFSILKETSSST